MESSLKGGGDSSVVRAPATEKPGALLTQVRVPNAGWDFSPRVNFQCGLSQSQLPVQTVSQSQLPVQTVSQSQLPVQTVSQSQLPVQTVSQSQLPVQTVSQSQLPVQTVLRCACSPRVRSRAPTYVRKLEIPIACLDTGKYYTH